MKHFFLLLFFLLFLISPVLAQKPVASEKMMLSEPVKGMPAVTINKPTFLGQDHYYSVTFRGNGEAIVNLKAIFSNLLEEDLTTVSFRVPRVIPNDIIAYQVIKEPQCVQNYLSPQPYPLKGADFQEGQSLPGSAGSSSKTMMPRQKDGCAEYSQPDYYSYDYANTKYQKAEVSLEADTLTVSLPQPVKSNSTSSVIIYYSAAGYVSKNVFGAFNYKFETLKVEDKLRTLQVGISTDSDWYLRGVQGKVNYRLSESALSFKGAGINAPTMHPQFMDYYQEIGGGALVKNAYNLQPLDSYTVSGSYANSRLKLYGKEIAVGVIVVILIILGLVILIRTILRRLKKTQGESHMGNVALSVAVSFTSSFLATIYTLFIFLLNRMVSSGYYYEWIGIFIILLVLISLGVFTVLLLVPSVVIGIKRGIMWGFVTFILTIGWLIFFFIVAFMFIFLFTQGGQSYPYPMPVPGVMMEKAM